MLCSHLCLFKFQMFLFKFILFDWLYEEEDDEKGEDKYEQFYSEHTQVHLLGMSLSNIISFQFIYKENNF